MMKDTLSLDDVLNKISEDGLRITLPRKGILEILFESDEYLSADEIYSRVHKRYPGVGLATVYRTLILLAEIGVLTKFEFGEGKARYEIAESTTGENHHHVLVCTSCFKVIKYSDFTSDERDCMKRNEQHLEKTHGFSINRHVVQFYGVCRDCQRS
ncbi:MAG: transcriptional repressor [Spirochaetales bacterium]|nr:transcriptional repressor [Spirochaetales bacterium]